MFTSVWRSQCHSHTFWNSMAALASGCCPLLAVHHGLDRKYLHSSVPSKCESIHSRASRVPFAAAVNSRSRGAYHQLLEARQWKREGVTNPVVSAKTVLQSSIRISGRAKRGGLQTSAEDRGLRHMASSAVPRVENLVVDFDSTCTQEDTSALLAELAAEAAAEGRVGTARTAALQPLREKWAALVQSYAAGFSRALDQALEEALKAHSSEARAVNVAGLRVFLARLSAFERGATANVADARALQGITRERICAAVARDGRAPLRPGCWAALEKIADRKIHTAVLSVNWSADLVAAALPPLPGPVCIRCNDLEYDDRGVSTGRILGDVHTPLDKERAFLEILAALGSGAAASGEAREEERLGGLTAYVGDSMTDLLPLLLADVGIVIGHSSTLRRVASAFNIPILPLLSPTLPAKDPGEANDGHRPLLEAQSWADIETFILRPVVDGQNGFPLNSSSPSLFASSSSLSSSSFSTSSSPALSLDPAAPMSSPLSSPLGAPRGSRSLVSAAATRPLTPALTFSIVNVDLFGTGLHGVSGRGTARLPRAGVGEGGVATAVEEDIADVAPSDWRVPGRGGVPRVLAIAGSDSGGGAGIQADVKACAARGAFCTTAISALTAQNTAGVQGVYVVPSDFLAAQMRSVLSDMGADVVKTGMLPSPEIIHSLCDVLGSQPYGALVVDPVMVATSGDVLAGEEVLQALRERLLPLADLVTPNLPEACRILGKSLSTVRSLDDAREAAREIHAKGPRFVLVKGGHFEDEEEAVDILFDGKKYHEFRAPRVRTRNTHGTGCTLASTISAELAKGAPMLDAIKAAKEYVTEALEESKSLQIGRGAQGPLNHFFSLAAWGTSSAPRPPLGSGWPTPGSPRWRFRGSDLFLYAVTDSSMNAKWNRSNEEAIAAAIEGGATFLQLREKDVDTGAFVREALSVVARARDAGVPLVINDRIDVALASGADGVHIGQSDMPVALARRLLGPDRILGVSCKTPAHALQAAADGADYIGCGGVFPTNTKKNNLTIGVEGLLEVCRASPIPAVAIGGIKAGNAGGVLTSGRGGPGPYGIAIVSGVFDQPDVASVTRELSTSLREAMAAMVAKLGEPTTK